MRPNISSHRMEAHPIHGWEDVTYTCSGSKYPPPSPTVYATINMPNNLGEKLDEIIRLQKEILTELRKKK